MSGKTNICLVISHLHFDVGFRMYSFKLTYRTPGGGSGFRKISDPDPVLEKISDSDPVLVKSRIRIRF